MSDNAFRPSQLAAAACFAEAHAQLELMTAVDLDTLEIEVFRRRGSTLTSSAHIPGMMNLYDRFIEALTIPLGAQHSDIERLLQDEHESGRFNDRVESAEAFDNHSAPCLQLGETVVAYERIRASLTEALGDAMAGAAARLQEIDNHGPVLLCGRLSEWTAAAYLFRRIYFRNDPFFDPSLPDEHFLRADKPHLLSSKGEQLLRDGTFRFTSVCQDRIEVKLQALKDSVLASAIIPLASPGQDEERLQAATPVFCYAGAASILTFILNGAEQASSLPKGFLPSSGGMISMRVNPQIPRKIIISADSGRTTEISL